MFKTDVLVIGGGPAGISAALSVAKFGLKVTILEEREFLGGQLIKQTHRFFGSREEHAGVRGISIVKELKENLSANDNIDVLLGATAMGIYEDGTVTMLYKGEVRKIIPKKTIIATGAFEKYLPFENNDIPGIFGAGAVQTLMNIYGVIPAEKVLMIGSGNIGLIVSYQLVQSGVNVQAVVEAAPNIGGYLVHASKLRRQGIPIKTSYTIKRAIGKEHVEGAEIVRLDENWNEIPGTEEIIECDSICLAVGLSPLYDLLSHSGCEMKYIPELGGNVPLRNENLETSVNGLYVAGDVAGIEEATAAMLEGELAGLDVVSKLIGNEEIQNEIITVKKALNSLRAGPTGIKIRNGISKLMNMETEKESIKNNMTDLSHLKKNGTPDTVNIESKLPDDSVLLKGGKAIIECYQGIPCDPCMHSCPFGAIIKFEDINDIPKIDFNKCTGCGICINNCPGLAIFVINKDHTDATSTVKMPYEFLPKPEKGSEVDVLNREGIKICDGKVIQILDGPKQDKTSVVTVEVPKAYYGEARNIRVVACDE